MTYSQRPQASGGVLDASQLIGQRRDRTAVDVHRIEKPPLPLIVIMRLRRRHEALAHAAHLPSELLHRFTHRIVLEVAQHLMAVADRRDIAQRGVEERGELILFAARGDGSHDLVEMQVTEELRLGEPADLGTTLGLLEQDALKPRHSNHHPASTKSRTR